ncbi:MAG TPA: MerR family transcriptional regulator [Aggregatilinea sp.]|uniref:MerR family transcriptional regulator n=1 Tax=Aggregatilinea sp. TaxID=2806333 RepID=UPI002C0492E3|nr:MerR family transcriptional regulator [Aggregatilinea sp.]HML22552.1 MerR family transcriptional regulator [Aggregatilinea sp.]
MMKDTRYTVKQLALLAGVSARTLHYYDEIGLLRPERSPANGYRIYKRPAVLRLQQILFLRELGLSLDEIRAVLDQPDFDLVRALEHHRRALRERQRRLDQLIETVEHTIESMKGTLEMDDKELFTVWSEEKQPDYEREIEQRYGDKELKESRRRWGSYTDADKRWIKDEGGAIYRDLVAAMPSGPASAQAQAGIARWHQHLRYFYEPTTEILLGLGDLYNEHPDFIETFRRIHPDLAAFLRDAIQVYCQDRPE